MGERLKWALSAEGDAFVEKLRITDWCLMYKPVL